MMGTRSGSIDPAIVTYIMRRDGLSFDEVDTILNKESGILGISGISSDMRDVLQAASNGSKNAELAIQMYVYRIQKGKHEAVFAQENYYYICDAASEVVPQQLDDYEAKEQFTLEFVSPQTAIAVNRNEEHGPTDQIMLEREAHVLELLIQDGHLKKD